MPQISTRCPVLRRGDTVAVVSTGFAVRPRPLAAGVDRLRRLGYGVEVAPHALARAGYLAGDDDQRAADLTAMVRQPHVRAVWFARGGYGTARLLDRLPWAEMRRDPKLLIGYSDLTALFAAVAERGAGRCLYGPVVSELGEASSWHGPSLRALLRGQPVELNLRRGSVMVPGRARGRLVGGNLAVLCHLCGTPFAPDYRGAVLLVEEIGEETYRLDRMLTQLAQAGALQRLAGVIIGGMVAPRRRRFPPDRPLDDVLGERFGALGVPVVRGLPVGHVPRKRTLPLGGRVDIDTAAGKLRFRP